MKVALVTHNIIFGDGQGHVNLALANHLVRRGIDLTLIANNVDDDLASTVHEVIPIETSTLGEAIDLWKVWRFKLAADEILHRHAFDAVIACGVVCSVPHTLNAVHFAHGGWRRSPFHAWKVNKSLNGAYQWLFSALNDFWERQVLSEAESIVAVSQMVKDELIGSGVAAENINVVVNGVDLDTFHPGPADRQALKLPEGVPLGLFVGDIKSPIKNPDGCLRALAAVPDVHLALAGRPEGSPLPKLAEELDIADRVHFLGFRRDIADLMRAADFFLLPSRRDSCPLVLLEALASGLPAIVSKQVGTYDLVGEMAGVVVDSPDDHVALAEAIRLMRDNPERRDEMSTAARAIAEQHSWERMAERYLEVLLAQVEQPRMPTGREG